MKTILLIAATASLIVPARTLGAVPASGPETQAKVEAVLADYAAKAQKAANDMAKGALRHARAAELCTRPIDVKANGGRVANWTGVVTKLDATDDGRGILYVRFAEYGMAETENNSLAEKMGEPATLIELGTPLYQTAVNLKVGERIVFSGLFFASDTDCFKEHSIFTNGSLNDPEFLFRFTSITPGP